MSHPVREIPWIVLLEWVIWPKMARAAFFSIGPKCVEFQHFIRCAEYGVKRAFCKVGM